MASFFVYVLTSHRDGGLYIGLTADPGRRLREHNGGRQRSTKARRPFDLVLVEEFPTRDEARKREKYYKSGVGRALLKRSLAKSLAAD